MSDIALIPEITLAGLLAAWNADRTGIAAEITHIGLGDAGYVPSKGQTALQSEKNRIPVAGGELAGPTQIHLTAIEDGDAAYWVREVGFFLADGTLFAIWSSDVGPLAYKTAGFNLIVAFDLDLAALPADSITVSVTGTLNLFLATELTRMATASVATMHRQTQHLMGIRALESRGSRWDTYLTGLREFTEKQRAAVDLRNIADEDLARALREGGDYGLVHDLLLGVHIGVGSTTKSLSDYMPWARSRRPFIGRFRMNSDSPDLSLRITNLNGAAQVPVTFRALFSARANTAPGGFGLTAAFGTYSIPSTAPVVTYDGRDLSGSMTNGTDAAGRDYWQWGPFGVAGQHGLLEVAGEDGTQWAVALV